MSTANKLGRLGRREWTDLIAAQVALLRAQLQLRLQPVGSLVRREAAEPLTQAGELERARAIALAVGRAAEHGVFRPRCLARAIALRELLLKDGITGSTIKVGVRSDGGRFLAHAWVTWGEHVLGDDRWWIARFTEVNDLRVLQDA